MAFLLLAGPALAAVSGLVDVSGDWRTASREPLGIAPDPIANPEPILQVYGARAFAWRGAFAVHTWVAVKRARATTFTVYEVIGWRYWHSGRALSVRKGAPDTRWFGAEPKVYVDLRGEGVEDLIMRVERAVASYPFKTQYRTWPGPNSNTFTAWVTRAVPELKVDLPPTAVGKDYLGPGSFFGPAPSGGGVQVSLFGLMGVLAAPAEGLEINFLGLSFGVDPLDLTLRLPGVGHFPQSG